MDNLVSFDLTVAWAFLLAAAVFIYVALDGFDLGLGILYPFFPARRDRDLIMNTVAPVWDGNETWLVLGGGGLFAAFPLAYAILMPALYPPIIAMLLALVFRGVAFEFRWRSVRSRAAWDAAFIAGSTVAAFSQGVVLGAILQGVAIDGRAYAGAWWDWLSPFSVLCGAAVVAGYALLGATWLVMKTTGEVHERARRLAVGATVGTVGFIVAVSLATPTLETAYWERWFGWPQILYAAPVPLAVALLTLALVRTLRADGAATAGAGPRGAAVQAGKGAADALQSLAAADGPGNVAGARGGAAAGPDALLSERGAKTAETTASVARTDPGRLAMVAAADGPGNIADARGRGLADPDALASEGGAMTDETAGAVVRSAAGPHTTGAVADGPGNIAGARGRTPVDPDTLASRSRATADGTAASVVGSADGAHATGATSAGPGGGAPSAEDAATAADPNGGASAAMPRGGASSAEDAAMAAGPDGGASAAMPRGGAASAEDAATAADPDGGATAAEGGPRNEPAISAAKSGNVAAVSRDAAAPSRTAASRAAPVVVRDAPSGKSREAEVPSGSEASAALAESSSTRVHGGGDAWPFLTALALFLVTFVGLGISMWPYIIPTSVTIWDAASPFASQLFMFVGAAVLIPIILAYTGFAYWVFRGKLNPGEGYH